MSSRKKLFISRELVDDSPILVAYPRSEYDWTDLSLLDFEAVSFDMPETDWLFFYSPRAVDFFYKKAKAHDHQYKVICYGPGTERRYREVSDRSSDLIGTGERHTTLSVMVEAISDDTICFVRGTRSVRAIQQILPDTVRSAEVIVYDSIPRADINMSHYDVAFITSPLSYKTYMSTGGTADLVVAIGSTTLRMIHTLSPDQQVIEAEQPSERGMLDALRSYQKTSKRFI